MTDDTTTIDTTALTDQPKVISIGEARPRLPRTRLRQEEMRIRQEEMRKRDPFTPGAAFGPRAPEAREPASGPVPMTSWAVKGWTRRETLALARQSCVHCWGLGRRPSRAGTENVCGCVLRGIFGACFRRFRRCAGEVNRGQVTYERCGNHGNRGIKAVSGYSMKNEEFMADFVLTSFRVLNDGKTRSQLTAESLTPSADWRLFTVHFLLGADWRTSCLHLGLGRGQFFHAVYRVEETLGNAFREVAPFALFPIDEYFSAGSRRNPVGGQTGAGWARGRHPAPKTMAA